MTKKDLYRLLWCDCNVNYAVYVIIIMPHNCVHILRSHDMICIISHNIIYLLIQLRLYCKYSGIYYITLNVSTLMKNEHHTRSKTDALRQSSTLNPHPDEVADEIFEASNFFDARDLVQVKYEMVRRVEQDGWSIARAARCFGFSRPSFYRAQSAIKDMGLWGLVPHRRGPRGAHKLTDEVMTYVTEHLAVHPETHMNDLVRLVGERFSIQVHRRSLERHLRDRKKNIQ